MPIIGVTHDTQGQTMIRRSVMTKVAIGRGPTEKSNYPQKLDHFIFLKKQAAQGGVEWIDDDEKIAHYAEANGGEEPTEIVIILLDDDIDQIFRTEYALWETSGKRCSGDGEKAVRDEKPYSPCANSGKCKEFEAGECKPSADLYFMLADFPSLGTVCRLHTSSYQSIRELYSALVDLRAMMGGRLFGLPVKLFVRPEKNVYEDGRGVRKTGTKWVLGLELRAESLPAMLESVTQSAKVFSELKKIMGGRRLEIVEEDRDRAPEIAAEFHHIDPAPGPPAAQLPAPLPEDSKLNEFLKLADAAGLNRAARHMLLGKHNGDTGAAIAEIKAFEETTLRETAGEEPAKDLTGGAPRKRGGGGRAKTTNQPEAAPSLPETKPAEKPAPAVKYGF